MQVHNAVLNGSNLVQEEFLNIGHGSAFMTREDEMVVLKVSPEGVSNLPEKIRQLVDRGFHQIVVDFSSLDHLANDDVKKVVEGKEVLENWDGRLALCSLQNGVETYLKSIDLLKDFHVFKDAETAVANHQDFTNRELEDETEEVGEIEDDEKLFDSELDDPDMLDSKELMSSDLLESSDFSDSDDLDADLDTDIDTDDLDVDLEEMKIEDSGDDTDSDSESDGPLNLDELMMSGSSSNSSSSSASKSKGGFKVKEMIVQADEISKLSRQVQRSIEGGQKHVTLRLAFDRRMNSDDVEHLRAAQESLEAAGGQLALASLQREVSLWLRLRNLESEFKVYEDVDEAEVAHRKHAKVEPAASKRETPEIEVLKSDDEHVVLKSSNGSAEDMSMLLSIVEVGNWTIEGLPGTVKRLGSKGVQELVVAGRASAGLTGAAEQAFKKAATQARSSNVHVTFCNFSADAASILKKLTSKGHVSIADSMADAAKTCGERIYQRTPFKELELAYNKIEASDNGRVPPTASPSVAASSAVNSTQNDADTGELRTLLIRKDIEITKLKAEIENLREEKSNAAQSIVSAEVDVLQKQLEDTKKALENSTRLRNEAVSEKAKLQGQVDEFKTRYQTEVDKNRASQRYSKEAMEAKNKLAEMTGQLDDQLSKTAVLDGRMSVLAGELADARERAAVLENEKSALEKRVEELEKGDLKPEAELIHVNTDELPSDPDELKEMLRQSEEDKRRILLDAEAEIERLIRQEEALREELECAGEMIERLGSELQL